MAEIDRIVVLDVNRDGGPTNSAEQEMIILRNDLISTDHSKGAGMVGYLPSDDYPVKTVGNAINDLQKISQTTTDKADQAVNKSNEALSKATTAESRIDNALLKGNNLSDLANKVAAIENLGAIPLGDSSINPADSKIPRAGSDGTIAQEWIKDLKFTLSSLKKAIDDLRYPDGIVPDIDWDFTAQALPTGFRAARSGPVTYCDKHGYLATAGDQEPVFEWDYLTGKVLGLRKEYPSTNIMAWSTFNSSYWASGSQYRSIVENYGEAPDRTRTSAFLTTNNSVEDTPYVGRRNLAWEAGKDYTASVFFKMKPNEPNRNIRLIFHSEVFGTNKNLYFNTQTGEVTGHSSPESTPKEFGAVFFGNGWVRVWMTDTVKADFVGTGWGPLIWYSNPISAGQGVEFWGMQVELGTVMTSLIKTTGAQATRISDSLTYLKEGLFVTNEMTLLVDMDRAYRARGTSPSTSGFGVVVGERNQYMNYIGLAYSTTGISNSSTQVYYRYPDSGDGQSGGAVTLTNVVQPLIQRVRCSFSVKAGEKGRASANGSQVAEMTYNSTYDIFSKSNNISFGGSTGGGSGTSFIGYIKQFQLYNKSLSNEKLVSLSTI